MEDWINSGPHVILLFPGKLDTSRFSTDQTWGGPYIMWAGTPYEHIMMPVMDVTATAEVPAALPATGGVAVPWLSMALALAGLSLLGGGPSVARRGQA